MILIWLTLAFVVGLITGIWLLSCAVRHFIRKTIGKADIPSDQKRMIFDTLGIEP